MSHAATRHRRRRFLQAGLALSCLGVLAGCGLAPPAPPTPVQARRVGLLHVGLDHVPPSLETLRAGLKELGYEEGRDIHLDFRNLADEAAADATAPEFVRARVDLIVAFENQTVRAVEAATSEIPVVFLHVDDPVAMGIVQSFAHPGGNMTGFAGQPELPDKVLQLFKEIVPGLQRPLVLIDPDDPVARRGLPKVREAAEALHLNPVERLVRDQADIDGTFASLRSGEVDAVFVASRNLQTKFSSYLIRVAAEQRLPVNAHRKEWVQQGALFSYGPDNASVGRDAAPYVDRILKGTRPADLPVVQPTQFDFVINVKTAHELGLSIPQSVVEQATEIIR